MENKKPENQISSSSSPAEVYKSVNLSEIYPDPTNNASLPGIMTKEDQHNAVLKASAGLQMDGLKKSPHTSKKVDAIGFLIILSGVLNVFSAVMHKNILGIAFDTVYITVGLGIIIRSELARKIVVWVSGISVFFSVFGLLGILGATSAKRVLISLVSFLFSLAVLIVVLSILTDPRTESEFS